MKVASSGRNFFNQTVVKYPVLSPEEEKEMTTEYYRTKDISLRNKLVNHNLRLVFSMQKKLPYNPDLFGEGVVGLIKGIEKFDPTRGLKLSTYVCPWIRAFMLAFIVKDAKLVKIGTTENQRKLFFNLAKEKAKIESAGGEFSAELLAQKLNVSEEDVISVNIRMGVHAESSLNAPIASDGATILDMMTASQPNPEEAFTLAQEDHLLKSKLDRFENSLSSREKLIYQLRMLDDQSSLEDLGKKLDLSRERVRQIQVQITSKLKAFCESV